jgi:hypothetical protein
MQRSTDMADDDHRQLFGAYLKALEWAVNEARTLRQQDFERYVEDYGDQARAEEAMAPFGPLCADPYIIGAVREYWLKCDRLNRKRPANALAPETFVLGWLRGVRDDLAAVIEEYPYWPVGQDATGRWI